MLTKLLALLLIISISINAGLFYTRHSSIQPLPAQIQAQVQMVNADLIKVAEVKTKSDRAYAKVKTIEPVEVMATRIDLSPFQLQTIEEREQTYLDTIEAQQITILTQDKTIHDQQILTTELTQELKSEIRQKRIYQITTLTGIIVILILVL